MSTNPPDTTAVRKIVIPYTPRPFQVTLHAEFDEHPLSVVIIHRRAGKTVMLVNHLIKAALTCDKLNPRFIYIAPFRVQAKKLAWDYLKYYTEPIPGRKVHETELRIDLPSKNGTARIYLDGADNADAHRGIYLDGAVLDEYAQIDPKVYSSVLSPALFDRNGWCIFSGTPNGRNHFYDTLMTAQSNPQDGWFYTIMSWQDTGIFTEEQIAKERRNKTAEEFAREYECSFAFTEGKRVYPEYSRNTHLSKTSLQPTQPTTIYRGWDNTGLSPAVVLTYLTSTGQWCVFKEFCFYDEGITDATEIVLVWCATQLPHGCRYVDYTDPAGSNRDSIKMTPKDYMVRTAMELGYELRPIEGIQTWKVRRDSVAVRFTRMINGEPAVLIDPGGCRTLVEGFDGAYAYPEIASLPGQFKDKPPKSPLANIQDALQYVATRLFTLNPSRDKYHDDVISLDDDEDFYYSSDSYEQSGRSAIGGY